MPKLFQSLQSFDLGHLHIIADLWGLSISAPDVRQGRKQLAEILLANQNLAAEIVESLPAEAQNALAELLNHGGQIPWQQFTQHYGEIREMGPGKRDREQPYLNPVSTAEKLWYLSLVARAFLETPNGPKEFAYIPEDLILGLPDFLKSPLPAMPLSRPATPAERAHPIPVNDQILDHAATLLAAHRMVLPGEQLEEIAKKWPEGSEMLASLLTISGLLDAGGLPLPEPTRQFLEKPRAASLLHLASAWLASEQHDDMRFIPHLQMEGEWMHNPAEARQSTLSLLESLDKDTWWSLPAFITSVKTHQPDFLRPSGDYQSWYVKDKNTEEFLIGFEHWEQVEGAYLRYLVTGPLHWLGMIELAATAADAASTVFRFSPWYPALRGQQSPPIPDGKENLSVNSQGHILIPRQAPLDVRYLVSRFCEWNGLRRGIYHYRLTPNALTAAEQQGLTIRHLLTILKRHSSAPLPPNVVAGLERWQKNGTQISFQQAVVLTVNHPDVLQALLDSPAKKFLGVPLGPTTVTVNPGALQKVMDTLMQLGYLSQPDETLDS
jgi:hypothetical protein